MERHPAAVEGYNRLVKKVKAMSEEFNPPLTEEQKKLYFKHMDTLYESTVDEVENFSQAILSNLQDKIQGGNNHE